MTLTQTDELLSIRRANNAERAKHLRTLELDGGKFKVMRQANRELLRNRKDNFCGNTSNSNSHKVRQIRTLLFKRF